MAIARFTYDFHIWLRVQDHLESLPHHGVVVGEQYPNGFHASSHRASARTGAHTSMRTPSPGLDRTVTSPPALRALARIPISPKPPLEGAPLRDSTGSPRPSSWIDRCTSPFRTSSFISTCRAPEWRATLVRASCAMRN